MKVHELNLNTEHFVIEHLLDSSVNRQLVAGFVVPNNAHGLESYLKSQAEGDEKNNGSRTFMSSLRMIEDVSSCIKGFEPGPWRED